MNSSYIKRYCLLGVFLCLSIFASAQPDPLPDDPGVPIDGGATLLVAAAAVYGAKKLKDKRQEKQKSK